MPSSYFETIIKIEDNSIQNEVKKIKFCLAENLIWLDGALFVLKRKLVSSKNYEKKETKIEALFSWNG